MAKLQAKPGGLTKREIIGYGLGDFGGCMTFALMGSIVTRYYTNCLLIDPLLMAGVLLIWNIWDAVNDPLMGALMDKVYSKHRNAKGKFRPWILRATPLVAVTAIIFWTVPTLFQGTATLVVLFFCKILYEGCYTMFNIPMGSLLAAMANNDTERATLSSARGFGATLGNMIPVMILPILLEKFGDTPMAFGIGGGICAAIGFAICLLHYYWTDEKNTSDAPSSGGEGVKFSDILGVFRKNRAFVALCLHGVCICLMQYVGQTLGTYMYSEVLGNMALMSLTMVVSMPIMIVVLVTVPILTKKFELVSIVRASLLIGFGLYGSLFVVMMAANIPPIVYLIWSGLASGISGVSIQMQWGMVAEVIDYNEMVTGKRTEGSIYGTFNLARRIGQSVGNSGAMVLLKVIGYDAAASKAGLAQASATIIGIKVSVILVPAIFVLGSWAAFKFVWNITPEIREKISRFKATRTAPKEQ